MGRRNLTSLAKKPSVKKVLAVVEQRRTTTKKKRTRPRKSRLGMIGKIAGGFWGPHGADLGRAAGNMISKITGMGDYRINSNSITNGNSIPTFATDQDGMAVCHREFISDIGGSVAFMLQALAINPGQANVFPFLSRIAYNFEEYDFKGLVFEYRPTSGTAISTTSAALGVVIMATNYDAVDPVFSTKQQMESYEFSNATVPSAGCIHPVECARNRNVLESLYIRNATQPVGTDLRMYDLGNFQIATAGMQSVYTVGELWTSYDCRLRKPRLYLAPPVAPNYYYHASSGPDQYAGATNQILGTSPIEEFSAGSNNVSIVGNTSTAAFLIREAGTYVVAIGANVYNNNIFTGNMTFATGTNIVQVNRLQANNRTSTGNPNSGANSESYIVTIKVVAAGITNLNQIAITAPTGTSIGIDVFIVKINSINLITTTPRSPDSDRTPLDRRFSVSSFHELTLDEKADV